MVNDTFTTGNSTQSLPDGVQTIPMTVTVDSEPSQQTMDSGTGNLAVNVNRQPVTLPEGSGTATINIHVETPMEQTESGQAVKSEPILTEVSQPVTQAGVNAMQNIQTVLLACIFGFLIDARRSRKKAVDSQEEMK